MVGLDHIAALEEELKPLNEALETTKKKLYFPLSTIAIGQVRSEKRRKEGRKLSVVLTDKYYLPFTLSVLSVAAVSFSSTLQ